MSDYLGYYINVKGLRKAGTEAVLARFIENEMSLTPTTFHGYPTKKVAIEGKGICAYFSHECYDLGETIFSDQFPYHGLIAVYDITSIKSFEFIKELIKSTKKSARMTKIILVGNKCDLESKREVPYEEALHFSQIAKMLFIETSALLSINIEEAFYLLFREIYISGNNVQS